MRRSLIACCRLAALIAVVAGGCGNQPSAPPQAAAKTEEPMSAPQGETKRDPGGRCWALIEGAAPRTGRATEEHVQAITDALAKLPADEIVAFDRFVQERLDEAYRWDLWAVGYIVMGGCGDDAFEYFRLWIVAQGRAYYEAALKDPVRAADALEPGDEPECELLLYAAAEAHERTAGRPLPPPAARTAREPRGDPWKEEEVARLYPELAKRFEFK